MNNSGPKGKRNAKTAERAGQCRIVLPDVKYLGERNEKRSFNLNTARRGERSRAFGSVRMRFTRAATAGPGGRCGGTSINQGGDAPRTSAAGHNGRAVTLSR